MASFGTELNVAVFGANGGIGRAFVDALAQEGGVAQVHAVARGAVDGLPSPVTGHVCDPLSEDDLARVVGAMTADAPIDLAIIAIGILHEAPLVSPEKTWRQLDGDAMRRVFEVNTVAPSLIAKHVLPALNRQRKSCVAALSARVGMIDDNRLGGWVSYRASKAALNMVIRTFSIELARRNPDAILVGLHPGTVDSHLSGPFQGNVPEGKLFPPEKSAAMMLDVLDGLEPGDSGHVFAYDGQRL